MAPTSLGSAMLNPESFQGEYERKGCVANSGLLVRSSLSSDLSIVQAGNVSSPFGQRILCLIMRHFVRVLLYLLVFSLTNAVRHALVRKLHRSEAMLII